MNSGLNNMLRARLMLVGAAAIAFFFSTCAFAQDAQSEQSKMALGKKLYMDARCFACHGEYGFGGAGPRFREDRYLGLSSYVIGQILLGRDIMPPFEHVLDDQQIAAVATYVRNSWGNNFGDVQPAQVAEVRDEAKSHPPQRGPQPPPASSPGAPADAK